MTYRERLAAMQNAGGNHQSQTVQGILKEGQKSYLQTVDKSIGTTKAPDPFIKEFRPITPPAPAQKPATPKR